TCNSPFVSSTTFVFHLPVDLYSCFKRFFGIVQGTTCIVLENSPHHTTYTYTCHITSQRLSTKYKSNNNRSNNSDKTGKYHFFKSCIGRDGYAFSVFRSSGSFHNSRNFSKLTTYFVNHLHSCFTYRFHS